nr:heme ABC exporter ATP-binding protein CcmA [Ramlibacter cellulosilyticus]
MAAEGLALGRGGRWLVRDIGFELAPGHALLVQGSNGCGKSTLLRTLCGLRAPQAGTLRWRGRALPQATADLQANLAYLGHADATSGELAPPENVRSLLALTGEACTDDEIDAALHALGLAAYRHVRGRALSPGLRRRAALARFWVTRRPLWVLDEPLAGLDDHATRAVVDRVRTHLRAGGCAVLSCHTDTWTRTELPLHRLRWS